MLIHSCCETELAHHPQKKNAAAAAAAAAARTKYNHNVHRLVQLIGNKTGQLLRYKFISVVVVVVYLRTMHSTIHIGR